MLASCKSQHDYFKTVASFEAVKTFNIKMPFESNPYCYASNVQYTDSFIVVYYYPIDTLFIYDNKDSELKYKVPLKDYHIIHAFNFISKDSIWVFGEIKKGYNDPFEVIDVNGAIKKKIDIQNYLTDESFKDYTNIDGNNFIYDNKLFFTLYYYLEDGKNIKYKKHPIIGYYDILKDKVVLNDELYFPYIKDGIYYPTNDYYKRYCPQFTINEKKHEIIISFSYTPTYYVWNLDSNKVNTYHSAKTLLVDTIIPFKRLIKRDDPEFYPYTKTLGMYFGMHYLRGQDIYVRSITLPEKDYGPNNYVYIFVNGENEFIGEVKTTEIIKNNYFSFQEWSNDSLLLAYSSNGNKLTVYLGKLVFKQMNQNEYVNKFKISANQIKEKEQNKVCRIIGNKQNIEKKDVLLYLKEKHNINDSTFSAIIINKKGCYSCNDYILNNFLNINKQVFLSLEKDPLYLLYIDDDGNKSFIKNNILGDFINFEQRVKIDTTTLYEKFNPSNSFNPRLILVRQNKILSDSVYMPDNLLNLVEELIEFYNFKTN